MKASGALTETKGWLVVGGLIAAAAAAAYWLFGKALAKVGGDVAALPGKVLSSVGDAAAGIVAGTADAVGKFGLATNDALGGLPGKIGDAAVHVGSSLGTAWNGETYTGYVYSTSLHKWTEVIGLSSGDTFKLDNSNNVLDSAGNTVGHFNG